MFRRVVVALGCCVLTAAAPLKAPQSAIPATATLLSDPIVVARFVEHMRDNMDLGKLPDGTPMKRETPEERKLPILTAAQAQAAFDRGVLTGGIEACGGDWQVMSYKPFAAALAAQPLSPKQIGFAIMLHDAAREQANNRSVEDCTPELKAAFSAAVKAPVR